MRFPDPSYMSEGQIMEEIHQLRDNIRQSSMRIFDLSRMLYSRARRRPSDDTTSAYILAANAWSRFSGMLEQGLRRASSSDRVLRLIPKPVVETPSKPPKPQAESPSPRTGAGFPSDVTSLYGVEMVNAIR